LSAFYLPEAINGYRVIWSEGGDYSWAYFLLLGVLAAFCLEWRGKQQERDYQKKRRALLEIEYPRMVDQFAVLMESGMTIRKAWERILARGYGESGSVKNVRKASTESPYLEEMRITWREIREGRGEKEAYERFGNRIGLIPYKRFASILTQNLSKGTRDLKELLVRESADALDARKTRARKMGEEAGAKMLFPMLVMLVLILLILLMPALTSMKS
ncbi:MAG: type II secretion system F family protein, partial [Clostridiales bacterium]|nr:type II secretion system F family protein [Clostridiales bacterium]